MSLVARAYSCCEEQEAIENSAAFYSLYIFKLALRTTPLQKIMYDTRDACTDIGAFSAQGWNLPNMYMYLPTWFKSAVVVNQTSISFVNSIACDAGLITGLEGEYSPQTAMFAVTFARGMTRCYRDVNLRPLIFF